MGITNKAVTRGAAAEVQSGQALIERWIEPNPNKRSSLDEHWLADSAVPVWAVIGYMPVVDWDSKKAAKAYEVPVAAIEAALAFYHLHRALIDHRIGENAAD